MKYNIRPELRKHTLVRVPMNPIMLNVINKMIPYTQKSNSPYIKDLDIEVVHFSQCTAQLIKPKGKRDIPCLVYFHGGGFVLKAGKAHENLAREYACRGDIAVLFVDYRLAPKYKYPAQLSDGYEAYLWATKQFDGQPIFLGGDSAGGTLALAVARKAFVESKRMPDKIMLIYPATDSRMNTPSMKEFTNTPRWNSTLHKKMLKYYADPEEVHNVFVSPAEAEDFSMYPKSYIETAEFDCLRDEGIEFARHLETAGVSVELWNTRGTMHGYDVANETDYVRGFVDKRIEFLKK